MRIVCAINKAYAVAIANELSYESRSELATPAGK